jgi:uncharacterized protein YjbI with pentapeptide repeats
LVFALVLALVALEFLGNPYFRLFFIAKLPHVALPWLGHEHHGFYIAVAVLTVVILLLIRLGYRYEWTGFGEAPQPKTADREIRPKKTLWDWMSLFIIPLILTAGGVWFSWTQTQVTNETENGRAQDTALQAYLDQMSELILEKDLNDSKKNSKVRTLARARTLTLLARLDPSRKSEVMLFLIEADLIQQREGESVPVISLSRADLSEADLHRANLSGVNLSEANLHGADLSEADLSEANLSTVDLSEADLSGADLSEANLILADLSGADLIAADLRRANLSAPVLRGADLTAADLSGARGYLKNFLGDAASLEGATMPDGQRLKDDSMNHGLTFEDWLKDRERRTEGGKNE